MSFRLSIIFTLEVFKKRVQKALHDLVHLMHRLLDPVICHPRLREIISPNLLRPIARPDLTMFSNQLWVCIPLNLRFERKQRKSIR